MKCLLKNKSFKETNVILSLVTFSLNTRKPIKRHNNRWNQPNHLHKVSSRVKTAALAAQ